MQDMPPGKSESVTFLSRILVWFGVGYILSWMVRDIGADWRQMGKKDSTPPIIPEAEPVLRFTGPSITCPRCHRTSHNLDDVKNSYCRYCLDWIDTVPE
jgi:hypothetical protein